MIAPAIPSTLMPVPRIEASVCGPCVIAAPSECGWPVARPTRWVPVSEITGSPAAATSNSTHSTGAASTTPAYRTRARVSSPGDTPDRYSQ